MVPLQAITPLLDKLAPGIPIAMINESLKITPFAVLARPIAGVRKRTVVVSLPGSPKGARENLRAVLAALAHAVELAKGDSGQKTHAEMAKEGRHDCSAADDYVPKTDRRENDHDHDHDASRGTHSHAHSHSHSHSHDGHSGPKHPLGTPVARRPRTSPYPLISVDEALAIIFRHCPTLPAVDVPVDENLLGCVLAADAYAKEDVPGYPASIVDGYAVIASDGPGEYPVLAPSTAGAPAEAHLTPGHIARVTTGAPVPPGTTAVVMVEYTTVEKASEDGRVEERVRIHEPAEKGDKIREVGVDCKAGTLVMKAGEQVTLVGGEVGILASVGLSSVSVYRRPRIGVLSSGNEVVDLSNPELRYGQVRDTNRPSLIAALRSTGFDAVDLGIATDDADQLAAAISRALGEGGCDALITTGGVSMGELDLLKPVLEEKLHGTIHFGRVKMKPGYVSFPKSVPHALTISVQETNHFCHPAFGGRFPPS